MKVATCLAAFAGLVCLGLTCVHAQQPGVQTAEEHPPLAIQSCTKAGGCKTEQAGIVMDAEWRWPHLINSSSTACQANENKWNCGDPATCAKTCALEGFSVADYANNFGVSTVGNELTMKYSEKFSSRLFLAASDPSKYRVFKLLNQEFTFDVDTSTLECGMNGAMVLLAMDGDGGTARYPNNQAGAKYGTGCCDAQCIHTTFVNGLANQNKAGTCCAEFDLWEANKISTAYTSHPSSKPGTYMCTSDCNDITDKNGCGWNAYMNGNHTYYGPNATFNVDSSKKITVVTQFITDDHTASGNLVDIRRLYVQDGKVIQNSNWYGSASLDSLSDAYCNAAGGSSNSHTLHGGIKGMGEALKAGMVLSFSIWTDKWGRMTWLDAYSAGSCPPDAGDQDTLMKNGCALKYSNIRVGDLDSTYSGSGQTKTPTPAPTPSTSSPTPTPSPTPTTTPTKTPTPSPTPSSTPTSTPTPTPSTTSSTGAKLYAQCGGNGWVGATTCSEGKCVKLNDWYYQCQP